MLNEGIESTVLVIRGAAKLDAGRTLSRHLLFEVLYEPRFAYARLPIEQHHLPGPAFRLRPPVPQQADFQVSANQRCETRLDHHLKAALDPTLAHHPVHRQWRGD